MSLGFRQGHASRTLVN